MQWTVLQLSGETQSSQHPSGSLLSTGCVIASEPVMIRPWHTVMVCWLPSSWCPTIPSVLLHYTQFGANDPLNKQFNLFQLNFSQSVLITGLIPNVEYKLLLLQFRIAFDQIIIIRLPGRLSGCVVVYSDWYFINLFFCLSVFILDVAARDKL